MKRLLFVFLFVSLLLSFIDGGQDALMASDFDGLVASISRGISEVTDTKDIARELFTFKEAANTIASLPVK